MNAGDIFQLLGAAPFGAYAIDLTQTVLFWNSGAERILGHRSHQVIGYPCYQVSAGRFGEGLTPDCVQGCPSLRLAREGLVPESIQIRALCSSGCRKLITFTPLVIPDPSHDNPILLYLFQDHTDEHQVETATDSEEDVVANEWQSGWPFDPPPDTLLGEAPSLTRREQEVLSLVAQGLNSGKIAEQLFISPHTVLNHIRNSRRKLKAQTKLEAVVTAMRYDLL